MANVVTISGVKKLYKMGSEIVAALNGVDLKIDEGEFVALMGPSGSGKSTLMNILGCLDRPTEGSYKLLGQEVSRLMIVKNIDMDAVYDAYTKSLEWYRDLFSN